MFTPEERALVEATEHYSQRLETHRRAIALGSPGLSGASHDWAIALIQRARTAEFVDPVSRAGGITQ